MRTQEKDKFIYPCYDGESFYNIVPTIFALFGKKMGKPTLPPKMYQDYIHNNNKIILFLLDSLGYAQFRNFSKKFPLLSSLFKKGRVFPLTSIFPSTTAAAITTLHTGLTPQEHGLIEWHLYLAEIDEIIQTLPFSPLGKKQKPGGLIKRKIDPRILFAGTTIHWRLKRAGVPSYIFLKKNYAHSPYSNLISKGANVISWSNFSNLFMSLKNLLNHQPPFYCVVYIDSFDSKAHKFGPSSQKHLAEITRFFGVFQKEFLKKIEKTLAGNVILILTSDHGQVKVDPEKTIYLNHYKDIVENFAASRNGKKILPWGSARDVYLKVRKEKLEETIIFLQKKFGNKALILESNEAFRQGLFGRGKPHKNFFDRIGNLLILPYDGNTVWYEHLSGELFEHKGHHGGLSEEEMVIPFGIARVSEIL